MSHLNTINVIIFIIFLSIISVSRSFIAPKSALIETRVIPSLTSISISLSTSSSSTSSSSTSSSSTSSSTLSRQHISRKNQQLIMSLCMNGRDDDEDEEHAQSQLKIMQVELDRCLSSTNPLDWLKAIRLERRVYLAMEMHRAKATERMAKEAERMAKEAERREMHREKEAERIAKEAGERKLINISLVDSDNVVDDAVTIINLSRDLFNDWGRNEKLLHRVDEISNTYKFEDVEEGGNYYLSKRSISTNFDGYAKAEANRQAQDCAEAIRSGQILIPPFNEEGTVIFYEYNIDFPKELSDIRPPIRPDAILIHGTHWLILEVKHNFNNSLLQRFAKVCDFIEKYCSERFVCKHHAVPTKIIRVACSKVGFSKVDSDIRGIIKLLNENQIYKIVDSI